MYINKDILIHLLSSSTFRVHSLVRGSMFCVSLPCLFFPRLLVLPLCRVELTRHLQPITHLNLHEASGPHPTPLPDNSVSSVELTVFISANLSWLVRVLVTNLFFSSCVSFSSLCFAASCLSSCFRFVRVCFRSGVSWPAFLPDTFCYFYESNLCLNVVHFYTSPVSALAVQVSQAIT